MVCWACGIDGARARQLDVDNAALSAQVQAQQQEIAQLREELRAALVRYRRISKFLTLSSTAQRERVFTDFSSATDGIEFAAGKVFAKEAMLTVKLRAQELKQVLMMELPTFMCSPLSDPVVERVKLGSERAFGSSSHLLWEQYKVPGCWAVDGGRIAGSVSRWLWVVGFAVGIPLFFTTGSPILALVLLFAARAGALRSIAAHPLAFLLASSLGLILQVATLVVVRVSGSVTFKLLGIVQIGRAHV